MGPTRTAAPALAIATSLAIALGSGCGSEPKPLSRGQLLASANSICRRVAKQLEAVNKGESANSPQQIARLASKLAGLEQSALGELGKLVPPATLEADWKRFVAGAQSLAEDTATLGETATGHDPAATRRALTSAQATQKRMAAIAKRDGFKECEQVP